MSLAGLRPWATARTPIEWLALVAGVACFGGVGWDAALWEPRLQLILHLMAVGVVVGVGLAAFTGRIEVPVTRVDVGILALVAAFALATVSALNVGMSLRALAAIVAFALMLPAALVAIRHRPSWVGAIAAGSVLLLSIPTLALLVAHRLEWILVGGPGLPPLRLGGEGTPFGSVAVPPFVIWPAWALAALVADPAWRRGLRIGLVAVGIPLTILSGSRSAWLAIAVTAAVAGVPWLWRRRGDIRARLHPTPTGILVALGLVAITAVALALVVPRALAVTSLLYRVSLWRDTLTAWSTDPLLGIGPGFMPIARQAAAPDFSYPVRQPHSHNLPLGVLGDAGVVGLVAALALVLALAWVGGPWRARSTAGRQAAYVLLGVGIAGLFEDITFEPNFNLLVIGLVAVALADAGAVRWTRLPGSGWRRPVAVLLATVSAAVLGAAMITADAGAIAYRMGTDHAAEERWDEATRWIERAATIDPWHPAGPKALAVTRDAAEDPTGARDAADQAIRLNPGDAASWTTVALLCAGAGQSECAAAASERAAAMSPYAEGYLLNAALVLDRVGLPDAADDAYRRSLLSQRLTVFGEPWPRRVTVADEQLGEEVGDLDDLNRVLAWWAFEEPFQPEILDDPTARALAHAILDEREEAETWLATALEQRPEDPVAWQVATVLYGHWGDAEAASQHQRIGEVVSGRPYPDRDTVPDVPPLTNDLATFRAYPRDEMIGAATRLLIRPPMPWVLEQTLP